MRGRLVRGLGSASGERALLAAVIAQALKDARRGSQEAASWLDDVGPDWCDDFLGIAATAAVDWRAADHERQRAKQTQNPPKVPTEEA
jgi:hypothetical protein